VNGRASAIAGPASQADLDRSLLLGFFAAARSTAISAAEGMDELDEIASTAGRYKTTLEVAAAAADEGRIDGPRASAGGTSASVAQVIVVRP
jgi:hypothetical protein